MESAIIKAYNRSYSANRPLNPEKSLADFCQAVENTLRHWVLLHTDAETWIENWLAGYEPLEFIKEFPEISNNYFSANLRDLLLDSYCENNVDNFTICSECGGISESGFEDCDCDEQDFGTPDANELKEWFIELDFIPLDVTDTDAYDAMLKAFEIYTQDVGPVFSGALEMIQDAISDIESCKSNSELLAACLAGTQVYHVHGNVMDDYGDAFDLDYNFVDNIRNDGIAAHFNDEEINEFLAE